MTINLKTVIGKVGDVVKSIPAPTVKIPPIQPIKIPPIQPIKTEPIKPLKPLKPLPKPKGISGPVDSFFQKIKDYFVAMKQRFIIAAYIVGGIIFVILFIKLLPFFSGIFSVISFFLRLVGIFR